MVPNWERSMSRLYIVTPLFKLYAEYIMQIQDWMKHKLESRVHGETSITSDRQMTLALWQKGKKN